MKKGTIKKQILIMRIFYGLPDTSVFTYIPFFIPSSFMGAMLGYIFLKTLEKSKMLSSLKSHLDN